MKRLLRGLIPIGWLLAVLVPTLYLATYLVEGLYEVPIQEESFRFERPWAALLLPAALLVLLAQGYLLPKRAPRFRMSRAVDLAELSQRGARTWLRPLSGALRAVAILLMGLALMGPQSIHARDRTGMEGIDIVLALDVSGSMEAADIEPNRFDATKRVVDAFIQRRPNDRIGAVIFAREAYTLLPLTSDKEALRGMIRELQLGMIDETATAIGNAVGVSLNRLRRSRAQSKVVILLTDGTSNAGNISPRQAATYANTMGVRLYTILMGRTDEAPVRRDQDLAGRLIVSGRQSAPLDPELLRHMAETTDGEFFQVDDRQGLERSFHTILDELERTEMEDAGRVYGELYPAFLWPALALLGLEALLGALFLRRWP